MGKPKAKPPLVKDTAPKKPAPKWKVSDPRWYEKAPCLGTGETADLFSIANDPSANAAEKELRARNICARCPVWEDCTIEGYLIGDTGTIRGGNRFVSGMGKSPCMLCAMPVAKQGRLCLRCLSERYCVKCDRPYATANADDEPGFCPTCDPEQNTSRIKKVAA